ncbi:DHHC palmitoyltransferase-domain-containing protein [Circinella umbellata]|nr:DHHC palmitoyltransferase-domain-containing protein [Circinella umbellata]
MTSDDSATLIGRSNNIHQHSMQQLHHLETTQEYTSSSSPLSSTPLSRPTSPHPIYQPTSPTSLQDHHYPIKTPSPIITNNLDYSSSHHHQQQQQQHNIHAPIMDHPRLTMDSTRQKKLVRNYKLFPGQNKFFCGGRFMTSREYWAFILALILLIVPSILFGIFTCPFIWTHIHPAIPIIFAYLFVLSLTSMIKTSWTDPGIIPRDLDPFPILERYDDPGSPYSDSIWHQGIPTQKEVQIKDKSWTLRYCETCRIYRPPRASHCRQCDNCVEVEDHHCIWLNNCIGSRNYRPFFVFITSATLLCLFVIVFSIVHLLLKWKEHGLEATFNTVFNSAPVSFVLAIVCLILLLMVGGLNLYHCSLILRGITTHEQLRATVMTKQSDLSVNPYNKGNPALNMAYVLCRPRPKSYLRRRKYSPTTVN